MLYKTLEYQNLLCEQYDGGLYKITTPFGDVCVIVERESRSLVYLKELLLPDIQDQDILFDVIRKITSDISDIYPAKKYLIRTPVLNINEEFHNIIITKTNKRFGMLSLTNCTKNMVNTNTAPPWYGPAFD